MKSDIDLRQDVMDELEWDPSVNGTQIGVEVKDGIVTLTGHVKSYAEKHQAERIAQRIDGVKAIASEMDVRLPTDSRRTDAEIADVAIAALEWNSNVPSDRIKVVVSKGWINLAGEVDWGFQRLNAERGVRYLRGVRGVTNSITVKPRVAPADIKKKIESALQRQALREAGHITLMVDEGKVTMRGTVHSLAEKLAAEGAVWGAPGVTTVIDQVVVE